MRQLRPILYTLLTPFNPKWTFRYFASDENKKKASVLSFVFGILILSVVYIIGLTSKSQYEPLERLFNVFGFTIGLTLKNLFIGYLLLLLINRIGLGPLKWSETLAIVSFALIPLSVGVIWTLIDMRTADIGQLIGTIWNAGIIIFALKVFKDVTLWKGALLVTGILIAIKLVEVTLIGIKI